MTTFQKSRCTSFLRALSFMKTKKGFIFTVCQSGIVKWNNKKGLQFKFVQKYRLVHFCCESSGVLFYQYLKETNSPILSPPINCYNNQRGWHSVIQETRLILLVIQLFFIWKLSCCWQATSRLSRYSGGQREFGSRLGNTRFRYSKRKNVQGMREFWPRFLR